MKHLLFTALLACVTLTVSAQANLDYRFRLDSAALHVTLNYTPVEPDSTLFVYGDLGFGGQTDIFNGIKNLRFSEHRNQENRYFMGIKIVFLNKGAEHFSPYFLFRGMCVCNIV